MYICYLDESGNVERTGTTPYFVLLGLAIPAESWKAKDKEVQAVLNRHNLYGEIHTAWMTRRYPEQQRIRGLGEMAPDDRRDAVGGWRDATLLADAQRKAAHHPRARDDQILDFAFEQVVTRYHHLLARLGMPVGIVVQDQNDTAAKRLTTLARRYHRDGTKYSVIDRIVETPLFVDSQLTLMVQMADLCAYATRRFFENHEVDLFDRIYDRFDRTSGKLVGLRHYTGSSRCTCRVCIDHGR